jgi:hypothetical protein
MSTVISESSPLAAGSVAPHDGRNAIAGREAERRMYVSEHTVAFYLRQAFRKLAIRSRVQLARIVIEQRPAAGTAGTTAS